MIKRLRAEHCVGIVVDVQEFFLRRLAKPLRERIETGTAHFANLLGRLHIPVLATVERPIAEKGKLPKAIKATRCLEKDFFDLAREPEIQAYLNGLERRQAIVTGGETDVCVLQSCLGLLELGLEVFAVEDLLFSSSRDASAAAARMSAAGVTFLTYKTLFHELLEVHEKGRNRIRVAVPDEL